MTRFNGSPAHVCHRLFTKVLCKLTSQDAKINVSAKWCVSDVLKIVVACSSICATNYIKVHQIRRIVTFTYLLCPH